jgi:hypothetical protein
MRIYQKVIKSRESGIKMKYPKFFLKIKRIKKETWLKILIFISSLILILSSLAPFLLLK